MIKKRYGPTVAMPTDLREGVLRWVTGAEPAPERLYAGLLVKKVPAGATMAEIQRAELEAPNYQRVAIAPGQWTINGTQATAVVTIKNSQERGVWQNLMGQFLATERQGGRAVATAPLAMAPAMLPPDGEIELQILIDYGAV